MRHFETKAEAVDFRDQKKSSGLAGVQVFKKIRGQRNRFKKPFVVGTEMEWLNLY